MFKVSLIAFTLAFNSVSVNSTTGSALDLTPDSVSDSVPDSTIDSVLNSVPDSFVSSVAFVKCTDNSIKVISLNKEGEENVITYFPNKIEKKYMFYSLREGMTLIMPTDHELMANNDAVAEVCTNSRKCFKLGRIFGDVSKYLDAVGEERGIVWFNIYSVINVFLSNHHK